MAPALMRKDGTAPESGAAKTKCGKRKAMRRQGALLLTILALAVVVLRCLTQGL
jgi:hypothetical protein